jgi:hypothetical protein
MKGRTVYAVSARLVYISGNQPSGEREDALLMESLDVMPDPVAERLICLYGGKRLRRAVPQHCVNALRSRSTRRSGARGF